MSHETDKGNTKGDWANPNSTREGEWASLVWEEIWHAKETNGWLQHSNGGEEMRSVCVRWENWIDGPSSCWCPVFIHLRTPEAKGKDDQSCWSSWPAAWPSVCSGWGLLVSQAAGESDSFLGMYGCLFSAHAYMLVRQDKFGLMGRVTLCRFNHI
jgi:hypothetical protein